MVVVILASTSMEAYAKIALLTVESVLDQLLLSAPMVRQVSSPMVRR